MKQELWLARDNDGWYNIYEGEPKKYQGDWHSSQNSSSIGEGFTEFEFHDIFGSHPVRKGRKRKVKRILIELED